MQVGALPREGLQWKAHIEARARTWNGKPDPQGHAQNLKRAGSEDLGAKKKQDASFIALKFAW
ncbi:MAG: hypothetical protein V5804_08470 [Mucilaginibacter sp.]|uniref:hypothetical protein n=1 Tax=Mucilaginibacter sp. TaxID=1882438 RepID=UPI0034E560B1